MTSDKVKMSTSIPYEHVYLAMYVPYMVHEHVPSIVQNVQRIAWMSIGLNSPTCSCTCALDMCVHVYVYIHIFALVL